MGDTYTYTSVTKVTPSGGTIAGLTPVTITGFGFDFATGGVTFGGSAATNVQIVSNTSITAVTPAHNVGAVDVVVAGVGTGSALYTYQNPTTKLMPPVPVTADGKLDVVATPKWLMVAKQRIETAPVIGTEQITGGTFSIDQIPEIPWDHIDFAGSSIADLETRSASDLNAGLLRSQNGGTGINSSAETGVANVNTGVWSIDGAIVQDFEPGTLNVRAAAFIAFPDYMVLGAGETVTLNAGSVLRVF